MQYLKTNTAVRVCLGPFLDKTDGVTPETALTVSNCKITAVAETDENSAPTLVLDNVAGNDATNTLAHITGDDAGFYELKLTAGNVNRLGRFTVQVNDAANHCPVWKEFMILPANAFDALIAGSGVGLRADVQGWLGSAPAAVTVAGVPEVDITHWSGTAVATPDTAGYPKVTVKSGAGTGEISLSSGLVGITTSAKDGIVDAVFDEALSGHTTGGTAGASLQPTDSGTAQAGGGSTITLRSGAVATDDYYNKQLLSIVAGTGAGQSEYISDYTGSSRVATMAAAWLTVPDATSVYVIKPGGTIPGASAPTADQNAAAVWNKLVADHSSAGSFGELLGAMRFRRGTAQAGAASSITLDAGADATNDRYKYSKVRIIAGTGVSQERQITAYNGTTKVATVNTNWTVNPSSDSVFLIIPEGLDAATVAAVAFAVWEEARGNHNTAGSVGEYLRASVRRVGPNDDATAADNMEKAFDGTGYNFPNTTIPTVTTLTGHTAQTGDAFARLGAPAGASVSADVASIKSDSAAILVDTNELQTDWVNGGRLDLLIDAIKAKTDSLSFGVAGRVDANLRAVNNQNFTGGTKPYTVAT